jgi:hypothetical protein
VPAATRSVGVRQPVTAAKVASDFFRELAWAVRSNRRVMSPVVPVVRVERAPLVAAQVVRLVQAVPVLCSTMGRPDLEGWQDLRIPARSPAVPAEPVVRAVQVPRVPQVRRESPLLRLLPAQMGPTAPTVRMRLRSWVMLKTEMRVRTVFPVPLERMRPDRRVPVRMQAL